MATTDYKEIAGRRSWNWNPKESRWTGTRAYSSSLTNLNDNFAALATASWTVGAVAMTPRGVEVDDTPEEYPGGAVIILHYAFGDNPAAYRTGEATLSIEGFEVQEELKYGVKADGTEDTDLPINTKPDADGKYWKALGDAHGARSEAKFILRTAVAQSSLDWTSYEPWIGKKTTTALSINSKVVAAAGELRLLHIEIPEYFTIGDDDPVVPLRFVFHYRRGGFPDVPVGQYRQELHKRYIYHETDDPTAENRVFVDEAGDAAVGTGDEAPAGARWRVVTIERQIDTATRQRYATADMSALFALALYMAG